MSNRALVWRYSRSTGYHYLEDGKYGRAYIQPAEFGGGYLAVAPEKLKSKHTRTVKEGKRFIDRLFMSSESKRPRKSK